MPQSEDLNKLLLNEILSMSLTEMETYFSSLDSSQKKCVKMLLQNKSRPKPTCDLHDNNADFVSWITSHFFVPELNGPIWLHDYQVNALQKATSKNKDGLYNYSLIAWMDIKKSIKSCIAAAVALRMAFMREWTSIKVVANKREQAQSRSYFYITRSLELNPQTAKMIENGDISITYYTINFNFNKSTIKAIPLNPEGEAGGNDDLIIWTEAWAARTKAAQKMWTEMVVPPQKFGRGFKWIESYAGFSGDSPILEPIYLENVQDDYRIKNTDMYSNGRTFCLCNHTPKLPWQTDEYYCLPLPEDKNDLMVLTMFGWKAAEDITENDKICTTKNNLEIEYQHPTSIFRGMYSGKILNMNTSKAHLSMTPNHRLYADYINHTRHYKEHSNNHTYKFIDAQSASSKQYGWIPGHGNWNHSDVDTINIEGDLYNANDFIEFLGWYISEGSVHYSKHKLSSGKTKEYPVAICIAQNKLKNPENYNSIISLCERLDNITFSKSDHYIRIFNAKLARYCTQFGRHSSKKFIPRFVLDDCSQEQMKIFLEAFTDGDGTRRNNGSRMLYTNSDQLKLDLIELAFKCGYRPRYTNSYSSSPETGRPPIHHISVMKNNYIGWIGYGKRKTWSTSIEENIEVWCPSVENGNFYVMQNGVCWWSGNSQQKKELIESEFNRVHRNIWQSSTSKFVDDLYNLHIACD